MDYNRRFDVDYCNSNLFDDFELHLDALNLLQLVNFDTWSRMVGSNLRSSCLDHVYVREVDLVHNILHVKPCFGDHELIMFYINVVRPPPRITVSRNWKNYSQNSLNGALSLINWSNNLMEVQSLWNDFETKLIRVVDNLVPLTEFKNNIVMKVPNYHIKHKLNIRKEKYTTFHHLLEYLSIYVQKKNILHTNY